MNLEVKVQMLKKTVTQTDIAKALGIDRSTVSGVVNGHRTSRRVQKAIADAVGVPYEKLWGKKA
jgi:transcriptional regulator with XRE-family HTH domain